VATLLFLGASVSQLPAIRHARAVGHRVVAVDGDPRAVAFPDCDVAEAIDFSDVDRVAAIGAREHVEGVLAISTDRAVVPAATVAAMLGLPGIGIDVARAMTDKAVMRSRLEAASVPQPRYAVVTETTDLRVAAAVPYPAVLKPTDSGGQRGLFLVESLQDTEQHLPEALAFARGAAAILEQYIGGVELNGLLAVRNGTPTLLTLSDRLRPAGQGFGVGWIHSYPSSLPAPVLAEAEAVAVAAVRALDLRDGIAFPQLIADSDGTVRIVEIAARIAAGQMADLVRLGTGIDLFDIAFAQALGRPVADSLVTPRFDRPIAIRFLTASPGVLPVGTVSAIEGLTAVRTSPGVLAADLYFAPGATIGPLRVDADRSGYVIATAATPADALELADHAAAKLVVRTVETDRAAARRPVRRRAPRGRRVLAAAAAAVSIGAALAFFLTGNPPAPRALLASVRIDEQLSPLCRCAHDVADVGFRVVRGGRLTVQMVNAVGRPVDTFLRDALVRPGWLHFVWSGRNALGQVLPNGRYRRRVAFPPFHGTLALPGRITIDTERPKVLRVAFRRLEAGIRVRYTFSEPAHAVLLVDGRRALTTRSAAPTGVLQWAGTTGNDRRPRTRRDRATLVAVDLAGNRSRPSRTYLIQAGAVSRRA
jgi:biotin carboxylase